MIEFFFQNLDLNDAFLGQTRRMQGEDWKLFARKMIYIGTGIELDFYPKKAYVSITFQFYFFIIINNSNSVCCHILHFT